MVSRNQSSRGGRSFAIEENVLTERISCNKTYCLFGEITWEGKQYENFPSSVCSLLHP